MGTVAEDPSFKLGKFHLRGRHVQHSHGRNNTGSDIHPDAMIALMPSEEDASRLRIGGGESKDQLHLTLYYLGKGNDWEESEREELTNAVIDRVSGYGPIKAYGRIFGVSHWNANSDSPCWVLSVSDLLREDREEDFLTLEEVRNIISSSIVGFDIPDQYSPWIPHVCLAYTNDFSLVEELTNRLGTVEFDRVRVSFSGEYIDIPLNPDNLVAAASPLRRNLNPWEVAANTDFVRIQSTWEAHVNAALGEINRIRDVQREILVNQVFQAAETDDIEALNSITLPDVAVSEVLYQEMVRAAQEAGEQQESEAESQGVEVPEWSLEESMTAAVGLSLLRSVADVAARIIDVSFIQSAVRRALSLIGRPQVSPEQVAQEVDEHLAELSDAGPRETIGGAISAAQNEGRRTVLAAAPDASQYVASEILDRNVCGPCRQIDGTVFDTLADATEQYPSGGYRDCLGGVRCRGTIVAVWDQEE